VPPRARKDTALKKTHSILFDDGAVHTSGGGPSGSASASAPALKRGLSVMDAMQRGTAEEDLDDFGFEDMMPPTLPPPEKKPRVSSPAEIAATVDSANGKKSLCPYGRRCYRKSPAHFLEFAHPWRDEENESAAASSAAPAPVPTASTSFAEAAADLFDAETQILPERPADRVMPQTEAAAVAEKPDSGDMRLVAVRNLLKSMAEDAASLEVRDHLQRMLELADSLPTALPLPKQTAEPPVKAASTPRSLASALLSTTTSEALGVEAREGTRPEAPPDPKAQLASELRTMGFAQSAIQEALVHCSTADDAVDWLLAQDQ